MSYKGEVQTDNTGKWYDNAVRFATHEEAMFYIVDLALRWSAVWATQVVESDDPVNYVWINGVGAQMVKS